VHLPPPLGARPPAALVVHAMKQAAGLLLYSADARIVVVHPSGAYNAKAPWSLPKGEPEPGETLEQTARRETREEVGIDVTGPLVPLGHADYVKSRKRVHAFAAPLPEGAVPRCASWEIDRAELLPLAEAREKLHPDLRVFVDRFEALES
jgi:predicted NUDIX family NTP pyrophosphohydrolase